MSFGGDGEMNGSAKRIAWVTGGGSGIGLAGAEALAASGWTVVISGRRLDPLKNAANGIVANGGEVDCLPLDVSNTDSVNEVANSILERYGRIDLLVNSAGLNLPKRSWTD